MKYTYEELIGKMAIARAEIDKIPTKFHSTQCPADDLTGHAATCTCGADAQNGLKQRALDALKL